MKRYVFILLAALLSVTVGRAMDYEEARQRAWFLTDKMAYELNLTPEQYDRAYEVNLNYLMSIRTASDCYGSYWDYRDADLRFILFDWQYALYKTIDYFFRPIRWYQSRWYFPIFHRYRQGYYFFSRPTIYVTYRGGNWRHRHRRDPSPYMHMRFRPGGGMRDRYNHSGRPGYRPGLPAPGPRPGGQRPGGERPGNARPGQRPGGERPGNARPGQRPGGERPSQRPGNQRPGNQRPSQRPGNVRPGQRPGNQRPNQRPGNVRPGQRPGGQRPIQRPNRQPQRQRPQHGQVNRQRPSRNFHFAGQSRQQRSASRPAQRSHRR